MAGFLVLSTSASVAMRLAVFPTPATAVARHAPCNMLLRNMIDVGDTESFINSSEGPSQRAWQLSQRAAQRRGGGMRSRSYSAAGGMSNRLGFGRSLEETYRGVGYDYGRSPGFTGFSGGGYSGVTVGGGRGRYGGYDGVRNSDGGYSYYNNDMYSRNNQYGPYTSGYGYGSNSYYGSGGYYGSGRYYRGGGGYYGTSGGYYGGGSVYQRARQRSAPSRARSVYPATPSSSLNDKVKMLRSQLTLPAGQSLKESVDKAVHELGLGGDTSLTTMVEKVDACFRVLGTPA